MAYKIAVASSDEKQIDKTFGATEKFTIYEVQGNYYQKIEERTFCLKVESIDNKFSENCNSKNSSCNRGCSGAEFHTQKVELISDCRCVICKKIGFPIQKQLEKKAISAFDVSCSVEEALQKIITYYNRIDKHVSLITSSSKIRN